MKPSTLLLVPFALVSSVYGSGACRADCKGRGDACRIAVTGTGLSPPQSSRMADCTSLNTVTVVPPASTTTVYQDVPVINLPGTSALKRMFKRTTVDLEPEAAAQPEPLPTPESTTVQPTSVPAYATEYCGQPSNYYSACSCAGATAKTTVAPTPTVTKTEPFPQCAKKMLMRRAREGIANVAGYYR